MAETWRVAANQLYRFIYELYMLHYSSKALGSLQKIKEQEQSNPDLCNPAECPLYPLGGSDNTKRPWGVRLNEKIWQVAAAHGPSVLPTSQFTVTH